MTSVVNQRLKLILIVTTLCPVLYLAMRSGTISYLRVKLGETCAKSEILRPEPAVVSSVATTVKMKPSLVTPVIVQNRKLLPKNAKFKKKIAEKR